MHPLEMLDAAEAFSRMGVGAPPVESEPIEQWAIEGVNILFSSRQVCIPSFLYLAAFVYLCPSQT